MKHHQINPNFFVEVDINIKQLHKKFHNYWIINLAYKNHGARIS
jgi:hypothetical protein